MATTIRPIPDDPNDNAPSDVISTPEGDNELLPHEPLQPSADASVSGLETPRGSEPDSYKTGKA